MFLSVGGTFGFTLKSLASEALLTSPCHFLALKAAWHHLGVPWPPRCLREREASSALLKDPCPGSLNESNFLILTPNIFLTIAIYSSLLWALSIILSLFVSIPYMHVFLEIIQLFSPFPCLWKIKGWNLWIAHLRLQTSPNFPLVSSLGFFFSI